MNTLLEIPGVQAACLADESGHMITSVGAAVPPSSAVFVLAHATLSAASELGRRSGTGDCLEITQRHAGGLVYLRGLPQRRTLLVLCLPDADIRLVSHAAESLNTPQLTPVRKVAVPAMDLGSALYAMPAW